MNTNYLGIPSDLWTTINAYTSVTSFRDIPEHFTANIHNLPLDLLSGRSDVMSSLLLKARGDVDRIYQDTATPQQRAIRQFCRSTPPVILLPATFNALRTSISHFII